MEKDIERLKPPVRVCLIAKESNTSLTVRDELLEFCPPSSIPVAEDEQPKGLRSRLFEHQSKCSQDDIDPFLAPKVTASSDHDVGRCYPELPPHSGTSGRARSKTLDVGSIRNAEYASGID